MLGKIFDKILRENEEEIEEVEATEVKEERAQEETLRQAQGGSFIKRASVPFLILLLALAARLYFIFIISGTQNAGVGWYGDTYHHWQIAYLTKTIGLKHSFLRLWDLKGMEYFWGPLHPLLLSFLFWITGSADILITRIVSMSFGLGCLALLYTLVRRYWNTRAALAILFFGALFPIAVFNDVSGMLEPIGVFFLLLGVYFWPKIPFLVGFSWALATMVRAEAWTFSLGLLFGLLWLREHGERKIIVFLGWVVPMVLYMKYLLDSTGNAIYPVYWNYLANALGAWAGPDPLTSLQLSMKPYLIGAAIVSGLALAITLFRRKRPSLFLLLGWGNIFFVGAFMGFSHYLAGWEWWFPYIRFFVFPYLFLASLVFVIASQIRGKRLNLVFDLLLAILVVAVTLATQLTWPPIMKRFKLTVPTWERNVRWGEQVGSVYQGGTLLFPEGEPNFTYAVVSVGGITGENILGQMFDPFYYIGEDEAFEEWDKHRETVLDWLSEYDVRLAVFRKDTSRYRELIKREPDLFEKVGELEGGVYEVWRVSPSPSS